MNYIAEIRAFYDWVESQPSVSASCISLWHGLLFQANKTGWKPEFSVTISTLELRTGLKRGAIYKARNKLRQCGAIDFKERDGNQSAIYSINSLCLFNEHNSDTTVNTTATQTDTQQRHNREPLLNITETKQNETNYNTPPTPRKRGKRADANKPPKTQYAEFVSMTNDEYSSLIAKIGEQGTVRCVEILDNYKGSTGKTYVSDYRTILSWVIKRYKEEQLGRPLGTQQPQKSKFAAAYKGREWDYDKLEKLAQDYVENNLNDGKDGGQ